MGDSGYGNQDNHHPGALDVDVDWILGGGKSGNKTRQILRQKVSLDRRFPLCSTGSQLSLNAYFYVFFFFYSYADQ
jgi:hypothetical protein